MILNKGKYCTNFWIEVLLWLCLILLLIGAFAAIAYQIEAIRFRYPLDYGEAPLVNQAMQINAGQSIYHAKINQAPFTIANYPPIYVLILSIFEKAFGPGFWYGRLISVLSAWGSATLLVLITFSHSKNMLMALITGLLFINLPYVIGWSTLARIDHLALFFALLGLFLIIKRPTSEKILDHPLILGALFLILAIYTRQSYALAAPLGGFLYLLQKHWKRALTLAGLVAGGVLLIFFSINVLTDGGFFFNIVTANVNPFDLARVVHNFRSFFASTPTLFILAALGLISILNRIDGWPLLTGFALGAFLSALTIGKIGSNINYFLEFSASLCLLVGFGLIVLYQRTRKLFPVIMLCTSLIFLSWQVIEVIREVQLETKNALRDRIKAQDDLLTMEKLVRNHLDEPILADEFMGMLTINDKSLYLQPFEITQLALAGLFDQKILIEQIEQEEFSLILLQEGSWWVNVVQERWTPEMLDAIHENYRITAKLENTNVYRPKTRRKIEIPTSCTAGMWPLPTKAYLGYRYKQGTLIFFGAGAEGQVPVIAPADGLAYRPKNFPEGSLLIVHEDPFNAGEQVISLFEDMRSFREQGDLISDHFPVGSEGVFVKRGDFIGYQSTWSGNPQQPAWLHVRYSLAGYAPTYLEDYEMITSKLINPGGYFGIKIDLEMESVKPIECLP